MGEGYEFNPAGEAEEIKNEIAKLNQKLIALNSHESHFPDDIAADEMLKKTYQSKIEALKKKLPQ